MSNSVVFGGILGGVLGGVCAFALSRSLPPPPPAAVTDGGSNATPSEARPLAEKLIGLLKAGNNAEFITQMRTTFLSLSDEDYNRLMHTLVVEQRAKFAKDFGKSLDFEFLREQTLGPNLARFAFAERFTQGCVVWVIDLYNSPDGWMPHGFRYLTVERAFEIVK